MSSLHHIMSSYCHIMSSPWCFLTQPQKVTTSRLRMNYWIHSLSWSSSSSSSPSCSSSSSSISSSSSRWKRTEQTRGWGYLLQLILPFLWTEHHFFFLPSASSSASSPLPCDGHCPSQWSPHESSMQCCHDSTTINQSCILPQHRLLLKANLCSLQSLSLSSQHLVQLKLNHPVRGIKKERWAVIHLF